MKLIPITVVSLLLVLMGIPLPLRAANQAEPIIVNQYVGGTVERVDLIGLRLTVQTDLGKSEAMPVASADVIKNLSKGDRVSAELDEQGRVVNVVKSDPEPAAPKPKG